MAATDAGTMLMRWGERPAVTTVTPLASSPTAERRES
jgi:hypothetical protein